MVFPTKRKWLDRAIHDLAVYRLLAAKVVHSERVETVVTWDIKTVKMGQKLRHRSIVFCVNEHVDSSMRETCRCVEP